MKLEIQYGQEAFAVPASVLGARDAKELDRLVLLWLCADPSLRGSPAGLSEKLSLPQNEIESSLNFWRGAGALRFVTEAATSKDCKAESSQDIPETSAAPQKPPIPLPPENRPQYSGKELSSLIDGTSGLKRLIDECQRILGRMFSGAEINDIVGLSDYLRLDSEHILMLFIYCKSKGKTSVRYIVKTAYTLCDEGIDSLPQLEAYIKAQEQFKDVTASLRTLFGIGGRALTTKEQEFFKRWCIDFRYGYDIVRRAYDITIESTDKHELSLPYLNKILSNWYEAGYKTPEEIDAALEAFRQSREAKGSGVPAAKDGANTAGSFDTDEFFELALKRSYEKVKQISASADSCQKG